MFDSVLDRGVAPRRRLATGAVFSVFGHAAVLSLALLVRPPARVEEAVTAPLVFVPPIFTPAPAPAPKGPAPAHPGPARPARPRQELVAPAAVPKKIVELETQPPPDETQDKTPQVGAQIGNPFGTPRPDGPPGDPNGTGDGNGTCTGRGCDVMGMTAPILLQRGREPDYTQEALEAHIEGLMTVECVLTLEGRLQQCRVLRSLPYMERAVVEALMTRRYTPATLHGRPLPVRYTIQVKLVMPR